MAIPTAAQLIRGFGLQTVPSGEGPSLQRADYSTISTLAEIQTNGFFNGIVRRVEINDLIFAYGTDGDRMLQVTAVTPDVITSEFAGGASGAPVFAFGGMIISSVSTTTFASPGFFTKILGNTVPSASIFNFNQSSPNQLEYVGVPTKTFLVNCSLSFTAAAASKTFAIAIRRNALLQGESTQELSIGTVLSDLYHITTSVILVMANNDFIEVNMANTTDTTTIDVQKLSLTIHQIDA